MHYYYVVFILQKCTNIAIKICNIEKSVNCIRAEAVVDVCIGRKQFTVFSLIVANRCVGREERIMCEEKQEIFSIFPVNVSLEKPFYFF
jgi:hypothetical protein